MSSDTRTLADCCDLLSGQHVLEPLVNNNHLGTPYLTGPSDFVGRNPQTNRATEHGTALCKAGDILVTVKGSGCGTIAKADRQYAISRQLMAIQPRDIDPGFLWVCVELQSRALSSMSKGIIPGLSREQLLAVQVPRLGKRAEAWIGRTSELGLKTIETTDALIAAKREQTRGLMQQLLTGKVRFPGFTEPWKTVRLGDVAHEVSERNKGQLAEQDVCGVIKGAGLMPMRERVMGDDLTRYLVVDPHSFAYNPMRLNIGSIAFNTSHRRVLVSPDYIVFATRSAQLRPEYLNHVRASWLWERFVQRAGSGSVRTRIYFDDLAQLKLPIPTPTEQDRINAVLQNHNAELRLLNQQREALAAQRRGLMDRLLSGDIALPSSDTSAA